MRFSILALLSTAAALVSATASPAPTAAPKPAPDVLALAKLLKERQVSGQLPGLSGSIGTDGGCGRVGPISGCFGAAGSHTTVSGTVNGVAVTTTTIGTGTAGTTTTRTGSATSTASGTKATSSSAAGAVRDYGGRGSIGGVVAVVGLGAVSFAAFMA